MQTRAKAIVTSAGSDRPKFLVPKEEFRTADRAHRDRFPRLRRDCLHNDPPVSIDGPGAVSGQTVTYR